MIFDMYVNGFGTKKIADYLEKQKYFRQRIIFTAKACRTSGG
ncbi:MAG: recombinase family protein [Muribaculaceae bacterium]|nr:recombinase family protein [Muribaculaceae bacterium]